MRDSILQKIYPLMPGSPKAWSQDPQVQKAFREAAKIFEAECNVKLPCEGRGIVICGGGSLWPCVYVTVRSIRYHGCQLPIEVWYMGERECNKKIMKLLQPFDVTFVDALIVADSQYSRVLRNPDLCYSKQTDYATTGGFMLKSYAILYSNFQHVLYLDADNTPVRDPEYLFDSQPYLQFGAYFFPDKPHSKEEENYTLSPRICGIFDIPYTHQVAFDSGALLVDKSTCLKQLQVTVWWNDFAEYTYEILHGDKDTFNMAWRQTGQQYFLIDKLPISGFGLQQHDHQGNLIFLHRCGAKWTLGQNRWLQRPQEELLHGFISELKQFLQPKWM